MKIRWCFQSYDWSPLFPCRQMTGCIKKLYSLQRVWMCKNSNAISIVTGSSHCIHIFINIGISMCWTNVKYEVPLNMLSSLQTFISYCLSGFLPYFGFMDLWDPSVVVGNFIQFFFSSLLSLFETNNIDESSSAIYFYCGKVKYEYWINVVYFGGASHETLHVCHEIR